MTAGNLHIEDLCHCLLNGYTDARCFVLFCWSTGCQSGLEFEKKKPLCMFELCFGAQFSSALKEPGSSCQNLTTGSSSFQRRVEPLNHIIVLILKHYYVSIRSRQMKCTLL